MYCIECTEYCPWHLCSSPGHQGDPYFPWGSSLGFIIISSCFFSGCIPCFDKVMFSILKGIGILGHSLSIFGKKHPAKNCWMIFLWPKRSHAPVEVNSPKKWPPYMTLAASKYPQQMIKHDAFRW